MDGALNRVIRRFFSKCAQVIAQARSVPGIGPNSGPSSGAAAAYTGKTDKWFSLETEELVAVRDQLVAWSSATESLPPLIIESYVSAAHLPRQRIVLVDGEELHPADRSEVVLERWVLEWRSKPVATPEVDITMVYKRTVITIRCLFSLLRALPSWSLLQRGIRQTTPLKINFRIVDGTVPISSKGRVGLSKKIADCELEVQRYQFSPIETAHGSLHLGVSYRASANFNADDSEAVLTRQILDEDATIKPSSQSSTFAGSALRPVVSFTRPFKESPRRNTSSSSIHRQQSEPVPVPSAAAIGATPSSYGHSISTGSSMPRFSSSFARTNAKFRLSSTAASISSQSSFEPGSAYHHPAQNDVSEFLKFVDDTQRKSSAAFHQSVSPHDRSLARFQNLRSSSLGDSLAQLESSRSMSPSSTERRRHSHIPQTPSRLSEEVGARASSRSRLGFYDDSTNEPEDDNDKDDDLVFAFRV